MDTNPLSNTFHGDNMRNCEIYVDKDGELVVEIKEGSFVRAYRVDDLNIRNSYWRNSKIEVAE